MAARATARVAPPPAVKPQDVVYPFSEGDVVTLRSGGFPMTVQACGRNVDTGEFTVYVIWAVAGWKSIDAFQTRTFPHKWLKKVDTVKQPPAIEDDNMPF